MTENENENARPTDDSREVVTHSFTLNPLRASMHVQLGRVMMRVRCDAMRWVSAHVDARVGAPRAMSNAVKKGIDKVRLMYARRRRE